MSPTATASRVVLAGPLLALCGVGILAGCDGGTAGGRYPIEEVRTLGPDTPRRRGIGPDARRFFGNPRSMAAPSAAPASFAWDLPPGWEERPPTELRHGNFVVPARPELECFLTVSPGDGGGVAANLDRWRKQMGLSPLLPGELEALPKVPLLSGSGPLLDVRGTFGGMGGSEGREGWRLLGAVRTLPGTTVFAKMTGPEDAVAAERASFLALLASLRPKAGQGGSMTAGSGAASASPLRWTVPAGWTEDAARPMRVVTVRPDGHAEAECYVTILGGDGGGLLPNFNRWREQIGLGPLDDAALAALPRVRVLGEDVPLLECEGAFAGMDGGEGRAGFALLGVVRLLGDGAVFVKFTGPSDVLRAEKERFVAFCGSLER